MCFACDMEAMWFAVMEARTNAAADGESASPQPGEPVTLLARGREEHGRGEEGVASLLPPPERGRVGEGVAGGTDEVVGMRGESEDAHPHPPPGGGGAPSQRPRSAPSRRFACEETPAE
jgi:hypothetical protein